MLDSLKIKYILTLKKLLKMLVPLKEKDLKILVTLMSPRKKKSLSSNHSLLNNPT